MEVINTLHAISTKIAIAMITLFVGFIIAKLAGKIIKRVLTEAELNRILKAAGFRPLSDELARLAEYTILAATLIIIMQQFGITRTIANIIGALAIVIIIIGIALAAREFIPNATAGLFLKKKIKKHYGKKITIDGIKGKLTKIGTTGITLKDKEQHYIPYTYLAKNKIKN